MLDKDLRSIQEARQLARAAQEAHEAFSGFSEQAIDKILQAMVEAVVKNAERLARMTVEETGYGVVEHKTVKNLFASRDVYQAIRSIQTVGILKEDKAAKVIEAAVPVGVVLALTPTTNPTSTIIHNAMCAVKAGNAIIFSPHPNSVGCSNETVKLLHDAAVGAGAPPFLAAMSLGVLSALMGGITHYATGPAPIYFGAGYIPQGTFWSLGFVVSVINMVVFLGIGSFWWKLAGLY